MPLSPCAAAAATPSPAARPIPGTAPGTPVAGAGEIAAGAMPGHGRNAATLANRRIHGLARGLLGGLLAGLVATPALAQPQPQPQPAATTPGEWSVSQAAPRSWDIPAGPLDGALNQFGRSAGVVLSWPSELTRGLQSAGVQGALSVPAALAQLLRGTGLAARERADGSYGLERLPASLLPGAAGGAAGAAAVALPPVRVRGTGVSERPSEHSSSYTTVASRSATGLVISARETPQSISVITRAQIEDQRLETIEEALVRTPGISLDKSWGSSRPIFYSRGFPVNNITYDGVPTSVDNYAFDVISSADLAIYDRVEIVRGATGLLQGTGNPSATINLIRKRPTRAFQASGDLQLGSWSNRRLDADVSGPLSAGLRGRVVAAWQDGDDFVRYLGERRQVLYGALEADLGSRTRLNLSANLQNSKRGNSWGGLPMYADGGDIGLPRSTLMAPAWARHNTDNTSYVAELRHEINDNWTLRGAIMHLRGEMDFAGTWASGSIDRVTGAGLIIGAPGYYYYKDRQTSADLSVNGSFAWLGRRHDLVIGSSWRREDFRAWGTSADIDDVPVENIFGWDPNSMPEPNPGELPFGWDALIRETGLYAASRLRITEPLSVIVGGRLTWWKQTSADDLAGYELKREFVPYAGAVWDLNDQWSVYTSYTDILKPQQIRDVSGKILAPVEGRSYEAGVKFEPGPAELTATAALFRTDHRGAAVDDLASSNPCPPFSPYGYCQVAGGHVRSEGVELTVAGSLTSALELSAGYTYVRSRTLTTSDSDWRQASTNLPRHLVRVNASYRLAEDWKLGGSLQFQSETSRTGRSNDIDYRIEQGGYVLLDLMGRWKWDARTAVQLNLNNVFDRRYYQSISTPSGGNHYGTPRQVVLSLSHRF